MPMKAGGSQCVQRSVGPAGGLSHIDSDKHLTPYCDTEENGVTSCENLCHVFEWSKTPVKQQKVNVSRPPQRLHISLVLMIFSVFWVTPLFVYTH